MKNITITLDEKVGSQTYYVVEATALTDSDIEYAIKNCNKRLKNGTQTIALSKKEKAALEDFAASMQTKAHPGAVASKPASAAPQNNSRTLVPAGKFKTGDKLYGKTITSLGKSWVVGAKEEDELAMAGFPGADYCQYAYFA
jgi:hypothetical protein